MTDILATPVGIDAVLAFGKAYVERKELESRVNALKETEAQLTPQVMAYFEANGLQSTSAQEFMVYLRTEHWPVKTEKARMMSADETQAAFRAAGIPEYCEPRINTQGLRAWINEKLKEIEARAKAGRRNAAEIEPEEAIPEALREIIRIETRHLARARKRG